MQNIIKYNIGIDDDGLPMIILDSDYSDTPENKFFCFQMVNYLLTTIRNRNSNNSDNVSDLLMLDSVIDYLSNINYEMSLIIVDLMRNMGDISMTLDVKYNIKVNTLEDRDNLNNYNIVYENKLFDRVNGLKVLVLEDNNIYELIDGITNDNWKK